MPIQTGGLIMEPDNKGIEEFHVGMGTSLAATAAQAWHDSPISQLIGINEMEIASGTPRPDFGEIAGGVPTPPAGPAIAEEVKPAAPNIDIIDANDRVKKAGLAPHLKLPDQPDIPPAQLAIMMDRAKARQELDATIDRGPQGFIPSALSTGTSFAVGAVDPLNLASAFIPVVGELRYGKILVSAGDNIAARLASRAAVGAAEGVVGQAALEPLDWWSHTQDGRDFGMSEVLQNLMFGAGLGAGLHGGGGFISDAYRGAKGRPLYPFGPGEPMENVRGTHVPGHLLAEEGVGADALHDHLRDLMTRPEAPQADRATRLLDTAVPSDPANSIVFVDADKVHAMLKPMDRALTEEKRDGAKEFIASGPETWNPPHMEARVDSRGSDRVEIIDGVHRWNAMRDERMGIVPVEMNAASAAKARSIGIVADRNQPTEPQRVPLDQPAPVQSNEEISALIAHVESQLPPAPPSPAVSIINDLPQRAHEDAMRGAIANLIDGEPVRAGEMLEAAARTDPRIAESFEAFHGSPHDFDRFDNSKIGTGEGAQMMAYGHYVAENRAVADQYKTAGIRGNSPVEYEARQILADYGGDRDGAIRELQKEVDTGNPYIRGVVPRQGVIDLLKSEKTLNSTLYKVNIKPPRERFLQWETDLTDQPAGRAILEKMDPTLKAHLEEELERHDQPALEDLTGGMLHRLLERYASEGELPGVRGDGGHPKREASEYLSSLDVPGVEFLDQKSRKRGALGDLDAKPVDDAATRNFVVFNDKDIEITHKNGEPVRREEIKRPEPAASEGDVTTKAVEKKAPRGRAAADPQTWSLYEFLAHEGGLRPDSELNAIFGNAKGPFVPGFGALVRPGGRGLDDALRLAKDHGYMFDAADVTGAQGNLAIRDLLDKLTEQNSGRKQYRADRQFTTKAEDAAALERETHEIITALHDELEAASGVKGTHVDPKLEARVVEIITREGEKDVLAAYERAIMEDAERYEGLANARREDPNTRHIPGWDADVAGAASRDGEAHPGQRGPAGLPAGGGSPVDGGQPRATGGGDRAAPQAQLGSAEAAPNKLDQAADWRALAQRKPEFDDPDVIAASKAAEAVKPPPTKLDERVTAAEKADAFAKQMYDMFAHRMPEEDRVRLDDLIKRIDDDNEARETAIVRGGSCLFGVV